MAYNVSNFSEYITKENAVLTSILFAGGDTGKFAMHITNVKGSTKVPHLSKDATLQKGSCVNPSGSANLNEITLSVEPFTVFDDYCQDDLENLLPNTVLAPGSNNGDTLTWEEKLVETTIASIQEQLEMNYWQGNSTGGTHNLFDGFIVKVDADNNVIDGNTSSASTITTLNVKSLVEDMRISAPAKVKRSADYVTLVGDDVFDMYIAKEKADNLYHYKPEHDNGVYSIGGGQGKLIRVYGLNGTDRMFSGLGSSFIVGSDVENESNVAEVFYDQTTDKMYIRVKAKAGVAISNADEIVEFTVSA